MQSSIERAISNVTDYGDTDIFPYPIENRILFDKKDEIVSLLLAKHGAFDTFIIESPPAYYGALAPVGYTGFRWATQIEPLWNVYFLALVIELGGKIEEARIPVGGGKVFSYRFNADGASSDIFDKTIGWKQFNERALELASSYSHVISCDISEFYPRLNHHRIENALLQLPNADDCRQKIMRFLSKFSNTYSFGLPVGGPASRLLSELTLNQIDRLLQMKQIEFCRFADDFYLFANSDSEAFKNLVFLSQKLQDNQGLQLQKTKTRIMKSAEFISTNPLNVESENTGEPQNIVDGRRGLYAISLHFDPYAPTAQEDYANLKGEIAQFPILDILKSELSKSKINISLSRKLIKVLKFVSDDEINDAVKTLIENKDLLYPVYYSVLSAVRAEFGRLSDSTRHYVSAYVMQLIVDAQAVMAVDLNLQYAVRLLGELQTEESIATLVGVYDGTTSDALRRDIILIMANWRNWTWISDRKNGFSAMRWAERRAFIIASFCLSDEGQHWRRHSARGFDEMEKITQAWMSTRVADPHWLVPL